MKTRAIIRGICYAALLAIPVSTFGAGKHADHSVSIGEITKRNITVHFVAKNAIREACGKRAAGCAFMRLNSIYIPEDKAYGWTGTHNAKIQVKWESYKGISCKRSFACLKDGVVHAYNLPFDHHRQNELGDAFAEAMGLEYNPRRAKVLGHEMKHILTGARH